MRKVILIMMIILVAALIACGILLWNFQEVDEVEKQETAVIITNNSETVVDELEKQLEVIANNVETWIETKDYANESIQYIITDLDHNGRLEVILTQVGGTGNFSYNYFYEIDNSLTKLNACDFIGENDYSEADLSLLNNVTVYYDKQYNQYYYIVTDFAKINPNEYYEGIYSLVLKNGIIEEDYIASKNISYDYENNNEEVIIYADKYQNSITKDEYDAAANNFYIDCEKSTMKLNWNTDLEFEGLSNDKIVEKLKNSLSL